MSDKRFRSPALAVRGRNWLDAAAFPPYQIPVSAAWLGKNLLGKQMARLTTEISPKPLLHPRFIGAGSTLLMTGLATDIMYWDTSNWQWANSSAWLISAGLVLALVATIALVVDFLAGRAGQIEWISFLLVAAAALLSLLNVFIHSRDAWTSVVPQGIATSVIVTILMLIAAVRGWQVTTVRGPAIGGRQ
jgi:uncharacterized membrane protein